MSFSTRPGLTELSFSFAHAQFVWDCKSEPGVRDIFAKIWGTDKLTVSFGMQGAEILLKDAFADIPCPDGGTLAFPLPRRLITARSHGHM